MSETQQPPGGRLQAIGRTTNVSAHAEANDEERCWPVTNPTSGLSSG
jgi:hypothetical protein